MTGRRFSMRYSASLGWFVFLLTVMAGLQAAVTRQVLAFYYGWYGNPDVSQRWYHWKDADTTKKHIDESTHYPALGAYDSHDPKVIDTHLHEAKDAGLTGFIVS